MSEPHLGFPSPTEGERELSVFREGEANSERTRLERGAQSDLVSIPRTHLYVMLLPLMFVLGLSVGYLFWGRDAAGEVAAAETASQPQPQVRRYDIPVDDDPYFGPENALITIIEFSDYECPYCRQWHMQVYDRLLTAYPGQIRFVYRDFPLTSIHPNAFPAAEAANCAGDQGAYWAFHDRLFSMQLGLSQEAFRQYAQDLELDMEGFNQCLESGKHRQEIQADFEFAARLGISSTPTFFVNGIPLVGAQPFEVFQQVIEQELARESQ